ncbi:MAG: FABP family protein [Candidatus Dormiibacterota bacterium]
MSALPPVAELLAPFSSWLGRWEGEGRGLWEADPPFRYRESLTIESVPNRSLLRLVQRTSVLESGELSHSETAFLRLLPDQAVELVLAAPSGYVELHTGRLRNGVLALQLYTLSASPTARPLRLVKRTLELDRDLLRTAVGIAVGDEEVTPHVQARLHRGLPGE